MLNFTLMHHAIGFSLLSCIRFGTRHFTILALGFASYFRKRVSLFTDIYFCVSWDLRRPFIWFVSRHASSYFHSLAAHSSKYEYASIFSNVDDVFSINKASASLTAATRSIRWFHSRINDAGWRTSDWPFLIFLFARYHPFRPALRRVPNAFICSWLLWITAAVKSHYSVTLVGPPSMIDRLRPHRLSSQAIRQELICSLPSLFFADAVSTSLFWWLFTA